MKILRILSLLAVIAAFTCTSCKTKEAASSTAKMKQTENYRFVISFYSKGAGIDRKTHEAVKKFIDEHPKKVTAEAHRWGREGEIDYCLKLSELSSKEQKAFIEDVKKLAADTDMVHFSEDAPCVHKK